MKKEQAIIGRKWKDLQAIKPSGERANGIFLRAKEMMKTGGVLPSTSVHIAGLDSNVINHRYLGYLVYVFMIKDVEVHNHCTLVEFSRKQLIEANMDKLKGVALFRKAIVILVEKNQEYVMTDAFERDALDPEMLLTYVDEKRKGKSPASKEAAKNREMKYGLSSEEIDRIQAAARPILTEVNRRHGYEKMKSNPSAKSQSDGFERFSGYNPSVLEWCLDTPDKLRIFEEWYEKIHKKGNPDN